MTDRTVIGNENANDRLSWLEVCFWCHTIMTLPDVAITMDVLIVGVGSIGQKEVSELESHPIVNVVGVVDINAARRSVVSQFVSDTYDDLSEGIAETNPDLVRIATPPRTHYDLAKIALKAGSDVYLEKIMTVEATKARDLVDTADELGRSIYLRRNAIYTPVYRRAWNKMDDVGDLRYLHWIEPVGEYSDWNKSKQEWLRDLPGGIISEHLPHALYTVRWFLQAEPNVDDVQYEGDELYVSLRAGDKSARISYVAPSDVPMVLDIVGSKGTFRVDHSSMRIHEPRGFEDSTSVERRTVKANAYDLLGCLQNGLRLSQHYVRRELGLYPNPFYSKSDNYRQFTDIATGGDTGEEFRIDGDEGVRNVELFERIWEAAGQ